MKQEPICKVDSDGCKEWRLNGKLHKEDGPAVEWADGSKVWYLNGKPHREDGPAFEGRDGSDDAEWYKDGLLHRIGGPAVKYKHYIMWYIDGMEYEKRKYWDKLYELGHITEEELFLELLD